MMNAKFWLAFLLFTSDASAADLAVNGAQSFQTIDGYGVNVNSLSWQGDELKPALDLCVDDLGATIYRVILDEMDWETTNDNADPAVFNQAFYNTIYSGAKFEKLWSTLRYLNSKGVENGLMLNFMGRGPAWMGANGTIDLDKEDEFVEMIASAVHYAKTTAGIRFTLLAPVNEPDWDDFEGPDTPPDQLARIYDKLAARLDGLGLTDVRFVGPDGARTTTDLQNFGTAFMTKPAVMAKLHRWAIHSYGDSVNGAQSFITGSAFPDRKFWVTETSNFSDVFGQIKDGPSANFVWEAYDSVYNHAIRAGRGTVAPNDLGNGPALIAYNSSTHLYTPNKAFYEYAQLYKFVAPGAVRIDAVSNDGNVPAYAFRHPLTGRLTIVGRNTAASARTVNGTLTNLPGTVSTLGFHRTNSTLNLARGADVAVTSGIFSVSIPANTWFTLVTPLVASPVAVTLTAPIAGTRISAPGSFVLNATAASTAGFISKVEFFNGANKIGEDLSAPYTCDWTNIAAGTYSLTAFATDSAGNTLTTAVTSVAVVGQLAQLVVSPHSVTLTPYATQTFAATGLDALGQTVITPPAVAWTATGGGTISSGGLFTAGGATGGTFTITATSGAISGTASVLLEEAVITLGNTGEGTTTDTLTDNTGAYINACRFQAASNATLTGIRAKVGAISGSYTCALYADTLTSPGTLIRAAATLTNVGAGWNEFAFTSPVAVTAGTFYWLAIWSDDIAARVHADATGTIRYAAYPFGNWPATVDLAGSGNFTYSIHAFGSAGFAAWIGGFNLPTDQFGPNADPDGDGLDNLVEYALERSPAIPEPVPPGLLPGGVPLSLTYKRARPDVTYTVQASSLLDTWEVLTPQAPVALGETVTITDDPPTNTQQRFLRLRITTP